MAEQSAASSKEADRYATRGDVAYSLYNALGLTGPTSSDNFSDGGYLAGVASTLKDLGITEGLGDGTFGTMNQITRGEAFTLLARALKLVPPGTDIQTSAEALRDAGIVQGYADGTLGLNDPISTSQIGMLMERTEPMWDQPPPGADTTAGTVRDQYNEAVGTYKQDELASKDPTFAAYLQAAGVRKSQIKDEMETRADLFTQATARRQEQAEANQFQARQGINSDFENRGFYRSGARDNRNLQSDERIDMARRHAQEQAQEAHGNTMRELGYQYDQVVSDTAIKEAQAAANEGQYAIEQQYL